jgi:hypothetical protein
VTSFEFVFALYSIVVSLALTHMLGGFVDLRRASRVRVYAPHIMWALSAFMAPIGNWASMWSLREIEIWEPWSVILLIAAGLSQYVFCAFLTPDTRPGEEVDLKSFYEKERLRFLGFFFVFMSISLTFNFVFGGADYYEHWLRDQLITVPALLVGAVAFLAKPDWLRNVASVVMLGLMTYFLIVATNLQAG